MTSYSFAWFTIPSFFFLKLSVAAALYILGFLPQSQLHTHI